MSYIYIYIYIYIYKVQNNETTTQKRGLKCYKQLLYNSRLYLLYFKLILKQCQLPKYYDQDSGFDLCLLNKMKEIILAKTFF